jgi:hypothetical protein
MDRYKIKLVWITLILFISGCIEQEKDDLTLPVRVHLKICVSENSSLFKKGDIGIQEIEFEGIREAGGNVFFKTDPKMDLSNYGFTNAEGSIIYDSDIPQGIYNYMRWDIHLKRIVTPELYDDTDPLSIGLVLYGYYPLGSDPWVIPIIFAIDDTEEFIVRFSDQIALSANKNYEATLSLVGSGFNSISQESYENAEISGNSEHPVILISRNKNEDLYEKMLYQLIRSTRVTVNQIDPSTL